MEERDYLMWEGIVIWMLTKYIDRKMEKVSQFIADWKDWYHILMKVNKGEYRLVAVTPELDDQMRRIGLWS